MSMKNLMCKPCWFHWDLYYMSMKTSLSCHNVLEIGRANIILITLNSGEVRLYFLEIDLRSQIKTSWNFAVLPLLHLFYQKSPSSKSRIRVYLLLVDRDPTTTTHKDPPTPWTFNQRVSIDRNAFYGFLEWCWRFKNK